MFRLFKFVLLWLVLASYQVSYAQSASVTKTVKKLAFTTHPIRIDTLSIVPKSLEILDPKTDSSQYSFNWVQATLQFKSNLGVDSVTIAYQPLPDNFTAEVRLLDSSIIQKPVVLQDPFKSRTPYQYNDWAQSELDKRGNISRGISFGNAQSLSLQSDLNLQLYGYLTDDVMVKAAITDANLPIQPDGNTQQLQEFDQVYIQLSKGEGTMHAGDFQIQSQNDPYLRYQKKGRGILVESQSMPGDSFAYQTSASVSVSRGRFNREIFTGPELEGNQGPYRLSGVNGEKYIIVLSGTERVYIDGQLLTRGQDQDYIIDYNTAELTFTANQLITKDKRITIEFQYSDLNYARSMIQGKYRQGRTNDFWAIEVFGEQDAKNQPLQLELDDSQRLLLSEIGDDVNSAVIPNFDSVGYQQNQVLYWLDTVCHSAGNCDTIFSYATHPDSALYRVGFSLVGKGNGSYMPISSSANGRVFSYVGAGLGEYEAVTLIPTPKANQMMVFNAGKSFGNHQFTLHSALSNHDLNTFSSLDQENDKGWAGNLGWKWTQPKTESQIWRWTSQANIESIHKNFEGIERFRAVEFQRDWDIDLLGETHEMNGALSTTLKHRKAGQIQANVEGLNRRETYQGGRFSLTNQWQLPFASLTSHFSALGATKFDTTNMSFLRHKHRLTLPVKHVQLGGYLEMEKKRIQDDTTLNLNSFSYRDWHLFLQNQDTSKHHFSLTYGQRDDDLANAAENALDHATIANNYTGKYRLQTTAGHIGIQGTYRDLQIEDSTLSSNAPEQTILGRIDYDFRLLNNALSIQSFYEAGTGLERLRSISFLAVPAGQGNFTWQDANNNGVQELDEFYPTNLPDQRNYIKILIPTDVYGQVFNNEFSQTMNLKAPSKWAGDEGTKKWLSKFYNQFSYKIQRKGNLIESLDQYNPFSESEDDLVSNYSLRNTLHFNRSNTRWGGRYTLLDNGNKQLTANGIDSRNLKQHEVDIRWTFKSDYTINLKGLVGEQLSFSELFTSKNYTISEQAIQPDFIYQPTPRFRAQLQLAYAEKSALFEGQETPLIRQLVGGTATWSQSGNRRINLQINYINHRYEGPSNTPLGFELLDGLQPGQNMTWEAQVQQTLNQNIQISITYAGRGSESGPTVHTGGMQARAFF